MGRLTTIDDMEKKAAAQELASSCPAAEPRGQVAEHVLHAAVHEQRPAQLVETAERSKPAVKKTQAQQEVDFHGLEDLEKHSSGHIALIAAAVVIVVIAALKIANVF